MPPLVTAGNFPDLASAEVAASLLEAAGIDCMIPDQNLAGLGWQLGSAIQGVRLQVEEHDLDAARLILANLDRAPEEDPSPQPRQPDDCCVRCGSESIGPAKWKNRIKAAAIFFPPLLLAWPTLATVKPRAECSACGHTWR